MPLSDAMYHKRISVFFSWEGINPKNSEIIMVCSRAVVLFYYSKNMDKVKSISVL